jgi:hypothetical protein
VAQVHAGWTHRAGAVGGGVHARVSGEGEVVQLGEALEGLGVNILDVVVGEEQVLQVVQALERLALDLVDVVPGEVQLLDLGRVVEGAGGDARDGGVLDVVEVPATISKERDRSGADGQYIVARFVAHGCKGKDVPTRKHHSLTFARRSRCSR